VRNRHNCRSDCCGIGNPDIIHKERNHADSVRDISVELKIPVEKVKAGLAVAGGPTASDPGGGDAPDHGEVAGGDSINLNPALSWPSKRQGMAF